MTNLKEIEDRINQIEYTLNKQVNYYKLTSSSWTELYKRSPHKGFIIDVSSGEILICTYALLSHLGYSERDMIGKFFHNFIHIDDLEESTKIWNNVQKSKETSINKPFYNRYKTANNGYLYVKWKPENIITTPYFCSAYIETPTELEIKEWESNRT